MVGIRVPVVGIVEQAVPGQAAIDVLVVVDVVIVVIVDEIVASRLAENEDHCEAEQSTDRDDREFRPTYNTPDTTR